MKHKLVIVFIIASILLMGISVFANTGDQVTVSISSNSTYEYSSYIANAADGVHYGGYLSTSSTNNSMWLQVENASGRVYHEFRLYKGSGDRGFTLSNPANIRLCLNPNGYGASGCIGSGWLKK